MQNKATWMESTPEGFKVRVQFQPATPAEAEKTSRLLKNFQVIPVLVTYEGPLTVELFFTSKVDEPAPVVEPPAPVVELPAPPTEQEMIDALKARGYEVGKPAPAITLANVPAPEPPAAVLGDHDHVAPTELTDEQKAALDKPDPTDKPA